MAEKRSAETQLTRETANKVEGTKKEQENDFPKAPVEVMKGRKVVKAHKKKNGPTPTVTPLEQLETAPETAISNLEGGVEQKKKDKEEKPQETTTTTTATTKPKPFSFGADVSGSSSGFAGLAKLPFALDFKLPTTKTTVSPFANLSAPNSTSPFSFSLITPPSSLASSLSTVGAAGTEEGGGEENPETEVNAHEGPSKVTELAREQLKTGEEDEETIFEVSPSKLYKLEKVVITQTPEEKEKEKEKEKEERREWKEVCRGTFKLKVHKETKKARILMRAEATLMVKLNVAITNGTGCELDSMTGKAITLMVVENNSENKPEAATYIIRVGQKDKASELVTKLQDLIKKAKAISS